MARSAVVAAFLSAAVLGGAGCTQARTPVAAVELDGGKPVVLLEPCKQLNPIKIQIDVDPQADGPAFEEWSIRRRDGDVPTRVTVLGPPPDGWEIDGDTLTAFEPGRRYTISVWGKRRSVHSVRFQPENLYELEDGQVLVTYTSGRSRVMDEKAFRKLADDSC